MASTRPPTAPWRAACLRGVCTDTGGPHAVLALSAEQYLLLPLCEQDLRHWRAQVGRRVWVNMDTQPMRLQADGRAHHA